MHGLHVLLSSVRAEMQSWTQRPPMFWLLFGAPLMPFIFARQLLRDYVIACVSCTRRVRVSGFDQSGQGALCQCGARYRHARLTEWPIEERNSNV